MRLVSRMKRDWLHTGRRPSGLCGAALLVAARLHGFNCELADIKKVVKIGHDTIRKRLVEFQSTPSSKLTINEFMSIDLEAEHDPPAYINGRIKAKIQQFEAEAGGMENVENEIGKLSNAIEEDQSTDTEGSSTSTPRKNQRSKALKQLNNTPGTQVYHEDPDLQASANFVHSENPEALIKKIFSPSRNANMHPMQSQNNKNHLQQGPAPTPASLGLDQPIEETTGQLETVKRSHDLVLDGELDLDGIDDEEIDRLILSSNESEIKSRIWMKEYGEFLVELEEKREKKRLENEKKDKTRQRAKRNKTKYKDYYCDSKTASEAIEKLVNRQRLSNKIDYEALRKATEGDIKDDKIKATDTVVPTKVIEETGVVKKEYGAPNKKKLKLENSAFLNPCESSVQNVVVEENGPPPPEQEEEAEECFQEEYEEDHCMSASQLMQSAGLAGGNDEYYGYDEYD